MDKKTVVGCLLLSIVEWSPVPAVGRPNPADNDASLADQRAKARTLLVMAPDAPPASSRSPVSPSGHEFLTLESALRAKQSLLGFPGRESEYDIANRGDCDGDCDHNARSFHAWSAIIGVRWADIMGFRAGPLFPAQQKCLEAVAQDNEDVQYDHALRKGEDAGPQGGLVAIRGIRDRLARRFTEAVLADDDLIDVADGGATQDHFRVIRSFFLFGRTVHILQDSFSTYHGSRKAPGYHQIVQVNSYVCTPHAPVHPHFKPGVLNLIWTDRSSGDVIWKTRCSRETKECLKPEYEAAVEASRDLWIAFWRAHKAVGARDKVARAEIDKFLEIWMKVPASVPDDPGSKRCSRADFAKVEDRRKACLKATGAQNGEKAPPFGWRAASFDDIP